MELEQHDELQERMRNALNLFCDGRECVACPMLSVSHANCDFAAMDDNTIMQCYRTLVEYDVAQLDSHYDQSAKADAGKLDLTLVPLQIIWDIAKVREFGTKKYKDPDNWKKVEIERYRAAAFRHLLRYLGDPHGFDEESGLPHLSHLACNVAFLCAMETYQNKDADEANIPLV